jgi:DNA invertase Pin-like site-specific DNA recombinase
MVHIVAAVAEHERQMISQWTEAALAAAKARGAKLGGNRGNFIHLAKTGAKASTVVRSGRADRRAADIALTIHDMTAGGASLRQVAGALNEKRSPTAGGSRWPIIQVACVLRRAPVRA